MSSLWLCLLVFIIFSCKDQDNYVGFQKSPRLDARYVDIPLNPSVIQYDGLQTTNIASEALPRVLIGRYNDPLLGKMEVTGYINFAPPVKLTTVPPADATFDSLILQLNFDFYHYGDGNVSSQRVQVFELLDTLNGLKPYYANTKVATASAPLAETTFNLSPDAFDNALLVNADADTTNNQTYNVQIKLPASYGSNLFYDFQHDSAFIVDFNQFSGKYKGFALKVPEGGGDKIFGINPVFRDLAPKITDTKLLLYYTQDGVSFHSDFVLSASSNYVTGEPYNVLSYSQITTDRSATALSGIIPFKEFKPSDNRFYIQGGTSLITKLDLANFYKYVDTLGNIVFNSAELVVNNISSEKPPNNLSLRVLDSLNQFRVAYVDTLTLDTLRLATDPYFLKATAAFTVNSSTDRTVNVATDAATNIAIASDTYVIGQIGLTEFCQQIYKYKHHPRRVKSVALTVQRTESKKSVHGLILDPNIVLRVYYSKPIIKIR